MIILYAKDSEKIIAAGEFLESDIQEKLKNSADVAYEVYEGAAAPLPPEEFLRRAPGVYVRLPQDILEEAKEKRNKETDRLATLPAKKVIREAWLELPRKKQEDAIKALDLLPEALKETVLYFVGKINED